MPIGNADAFMPTPARPVRVRARNLPADAHLEPHRHDWGQLAYCDSGILQMTARAPQEVTYIVPPSRAVWIPPGALHAVTVIEAAQLRTLYVCASAVPAGWTTSRVLRVSPLLRELIIAAVTISQPYDVKQRDGRVMRLLLDEIYSLPELPLSLPMPQSPDLAAICISLRQRLGDKTPSQDWATKLGSDVRTLQRRFIRETGLTFGRWQRQARLIAALEQLALGRKIIDVALELGYESPTAFSTMFKRELGIPPSCFFERSVS